MSGPVTQLQLAPALVVLPGPRCAVAAPGAPPQPLSPPRARDLFETAPVLVAHAAMTARRLNLHAPPRSPRLFDAPQPFAPAPP